MTFADLMSLLLAFFVLLFSFSEMDAQKYKQVAGSMKQAFGVQREIKVKDPPKGINIIAQEFSAGTPDPKSSTNDVQQHTTDDFMQYLLMPKPSEAFVDALEAEKNRISLAMGQEIKDGYVEVTIEDRTIKVSIQERGSFASGSDKLFGSFREVLDKMAQTIGANPGGVVVSGHTDSRPIHTERFRSNWELSAARAVTVVHALMQEGSIPKSLFRVEGFGDTRPVSSNDSEEGRAENRRVEVNLIYDESLVEKLGGELPGEDPQAVRRLPDKELYFEAAERSKLRAKSQRRPRAKPAPPPLKSWAEEHSREARDLQVRPAIVGSDGELVDPCPGCN